MLGEVAMLQFLFLLSYNFAWLQSAVVSDKKGMLHVSCADTIATMRSSLSLCFCYSKNTELS